MAAEPTAPELDVLLENHRVFLGFLERRVGSKDIAEDILHDAFTKGVERPDVTAEGEAVVPGSIGSLGMRSSIVSCQNRYQ
jgi:RNA polymerase sigma-70 factor (ECF subfamily)